MNTDWDGEYLILQPSTDGCPWWKQAQHSFKPVWVWWVEGAYDVKRTTGHTEWQRPAGSSTSVGGLLLLVVHDPNVYHDLYPIPSYRFTYQQKHARPPQKRQTDKTLGQCFSFK